MKKKYKKFKNSPCEYYVPNNIVEYELEIWKDKRKRLPLPDEGEMMYKMNMSMIDGIIEDLSHRLVGIKKREAEFDKKRVRKYVLKSNKREYYL
jgi:hypothetical protein